MKTTTSHAFLSLALCCAIATLACADASAAYVPVFGGPEYNSATRDGYQFFSAPQSFQRNLVNNSGTAVGSGRKVVSGIDQNSRAFQWHGSGAPTMELSNPARFSGDSTVNWAYAINDSGTVVGAAYDNRLGERPMRWDSTGAATELGILGTRGGGSFTWGQAYAINNAGITVGYTDKWPSGGFVDRAVRWDASGAVTELGNISPVNPLFLVIPRSRAFAVNESGTAVGYAQYLLEGALDRGTRPVRWDGSGTAATELGILGLSGDYTANGEAYDVNESGTAVGWTNLCVASNCSLRTAVRWDAGGTAATQLAAPGPISVAYSINDAGTAVGSGSGALRWDAGGTAATVLGGLGTTAGAEAYDVNNSGVAVGYAVKYVAGAYSGIRAVAWRSDAVAIDLNTLIDPMSGWILTRADGISDTGWITGIGSFDPDGPGDFPAYDRLFLLRIPEPSSALLALLASVGLLGTRHRNIMSSTG